MKQEHKKKFVFTDSKNARASLRKLLFQACSSYDFQFCSCHNIAFFPFEFELFQMNHPVAVTHYLPSDFWGWLKAESLSG